MVTFIFTVLAYVLFGQYFADEYGVVVAFENTLLLIMTGLPDDYQDMYGLSDMLSFLRASGAGCTSSSSSSSS